MRYLRRGIDHEGNVANFVETELIAYNPNKSFDDKPVFSSFVIVRGSIPLFWTQDPNPLNPKPDIMLLRSMDVKYLATKRHYSELFERYSFPLYCINLTKEKNTRECTVSDQYRYVINEVLNRDLPKNMRIKYIHFDMKVRKKEHSFPLPLHAIVKPFIKKMGFFSCTRKHMSDTMSHIEVQRGVIRTNCIDSLDRTNEA